MLCFSWQALQTPVDGAERVRQDATYAHRPQGSRDAFESTTASAVLRLYEPGGGIAATLPAPPQSSFSAGHLLYVDERIVWARRIEADPRRLREPIRVGVEPYLETWGESCFAILSDRPGATRELAFWLGAEWVYRTLPKGDAIRQFQCTSDRVVLIERVANTVRLTTCKEVNCSREEGTFGELDAEGEPLLAMRGNEVALVWRTRIGDLRARVGRPSELSQVPDSVVYAAAGESPCALKGSAQQAFTLGDSAWFVIPGCNAEHEAFSLLSLSPAGIELHEPPPVLDAHARHQGIPAQR